MSLLALQSKLLSNPQPKGLVTPSSRIIDFSQTPLAPYYGHADLFAIVIDDLFTPEECETLLSLAESGDDKWEAALINSGGRQTLAPSVRDCTRIMKDDFVTAGWIYERVKPYLEDMFVIANDSQQRGWFEPRNGNNITWRMTRLNERLRFLRYTEKQYFKPHYDGQYVTPNGDEASFLTLHLYLNSTGPINGPDSLSGGATRFLAPDWTKEKYLDVEPKQGRVLVFQHARLVHSGEKVVSGVKYTMRTDVMYKRVPADEGFLCTTI